MAVLIVCVIAVAGSAMLNPPRASAHPLSTSAVLVDIGVDTVSGKLQLPIDRLAIALNQPLTRSVVEHTGEMDGVRRYVAAHVAVSDAAGGTPWQVSVTGGRVETIDGVDHVVFTTNFTPIGHALQDFDLHYDAIVEHLLSHRIFVAARHQGTQAYTAVGVIDWQTQTLTVATGGASTENGFWAAARLGIAHISSGADHLLFLLMLLLTAPLLASGGRWTMSNNMRRNGIRVVRIVTAFGMGHSITLALATLGYVDVPTRVVESLIALSIVVSAVHALRPLVHRGEVWIASGFGLMHGLAFAAGLNELDLNRTSLVVELVGFNLGIELTQLMVVALVMPSLMLFSRTCVYPSARILIACGGLALAIGWFGERTTVLTRNPLGAVSDTLAAHPLLIAAGLALASASTWAMPPLRSPGETAPSPLSGATGDVLRRLRSSTLDSPDRSSLRREERPAP
jgi:HupE / UreJ protein